ncbi:MAG: radical SAM protein, partial [Planctomycetota bacterium]
MMTQAGVYSENKLIWWYHRERQLPTAPKQVQLILSALCNQDCHFCAYRMSGYTSNELFAAGTELAKFGHNNPNRRMPTPRAHALLDEMKDAGVLAVQFTGGGEPTVHPDHEMLFQHALDLGLRCSLVSNGIKWSDNLIEDILPRFDWVRVSIDAADAESYYQTRRSNYRHWDKVWANVHALVAALQDKASQCVFGLGYVVTPDSWKDIAKFARMAKDAEVHNVRFTAMFSTEDDKPFKWLYNEIKTQLWEAGRMASPHFAVYNNFGSRYEDLKQKAPDYANCSYQYYTSYIGDDMQAYRCCVLAYNQRGKMAGGDLSKVRFNEFWASDARKDDMAALDARKCQRCQFNSKNRDL